MTHLPRKDFRFQGLVSLRHLPLAFIVLLSSLLCTVAVKGSQQNAQLCPLAHGKRRPPQQAFCNGRNRTNYKLWDTRPYKDMTNQEAFAVISAIHEAKGNCSKRVPVLNIRFKGNAFQEIADVAIRVANLMSQLLTRGACAGNLDNPKFYGNPTWNLTDEFVFATVKSNLQQYGYMYGASLWFLKNKYKNRTYFAPYVYRDRGTNYLLMKDLSTDFKAVHTNFLTYLESIGRTRTFMCNSSYYIPRKNDTADFAARSMTQAVVDYTDSFWSRPYFECSTSKSWVLGYWAPFFATRYDRPADDPLEMM